MTNVWNHSSFSFNIFIFVHVLSFLFLLSTYWWIIYSYWIFRKLLYTKVHCTIPTLNLWQNLLFCYCYLYSCPLSFLVYSYSLSFVLIFCHMSIYVVFKAPRLFFFVIIVFSFPNIHRQFFLFFFYRFIFLFSLQP